MGRKAFEFTLIVDGIDDVDQTTTDALYETGCGDALLGVQAGVFTASFNREAGSFEDAVLSAIADIRRANVGAAAFHLDRRDLVTLADVGRRIGRTKQAISLYALGKRGPGGFPAPAIQSSDPLYSWAGVAEWLHKHNLLSEEAAQEAATREAVGAALEFVSMRQNHAGFSALVDRITKRVRVKAKA